MKKSHLIWQIDFLLILILFILATIGIVSISSATYTDNQSYVEKQAWWYLLGFLFMFAVLLFDYKILSQGRFLYLLYGIGLLFLLLVFIPGLGVKVNGAQQWIGVGNFQFQPSEMMKLILILLLAKLLSEKKPSSWRDLSGLGLILGLFGIPFFIILSQPDLGTALVFVGIVCSMLLVGGLDWKWIMSGILLVSIISGGILLLYVTDHPLLQVILEDHQISRIQTFLDPASDPTGAGYQLTQAKIAIGSGMMTGKGLHQGTQAQGNWIPEPHNDFIFAVFAEEHGFIGGSLLLCVYLIFFYRMILIATRSDDRFGSYIVAGVTGMLVFQVFQNIGMTLGLVPITGLPLPFVSYGGSSLTTQLIAVGLVLNVGMRKQSDMIIFQR
ncbi:rod shape-determining protein RodA [Paenactinomyces guangxiensis]|uniref:Peptidoglycan glycosyltransferase RodA n=1 Tax=Paenactinomyces guangxiensis TaxID=1490290 RepID=A0A7W1WNL6_9BACL|nr:rod shape-determining protein RodA [Paenactinomyces guangxiensis]MBA4493206.1 rod shape-determining protein RodA [Paenactinomyces guangxiensis]MBH8589944.1 rod shape-determining protein RodA [Paenactinomyces guangxiensis]